MPTTSSANGAIQAAGGRRRGRGEIDAVRLCYSPEAGIDAFIAAIDCASPIELIELERCGVSAAFVSDLATRLGISRHRMFEIVGAGRPRSRETLVSGLAGCSSIAIARLLALSHTIVRDSTAPEAEQLDAGAWLGRWIETPQPALGGHPPADFLDMPTGWAVVRRQLGAIVSGSYQ